MAKQVFEIVIDGEGNATFETKEGFQGKNCVKESKQFEELCMGGDAIVSEKKTKDFYAPDPSKIVKSISR